MENETKYYGVNYAKDMTLRDYFAGQVMVGYLCAQGVLGYRNNSAEQNQYCAETAYQMADAMMKARKE